MMSLQGRTAVVTGAGSGIGRAIALSLARRGAHLALADINTAGLAETAAQVAGVRVSQHRLDVADRDAVAAFPNDVLDDHPGVDIVVNNAGVALGGTFEQVSEADFEWLFGVNFWGVVRMTRAFLPLLRASDDAHLVNLSSLYGLISPPGQTAYSASKFAVRGFSNALRAELKGTRIAVTVVHPGGVATRIARDARLAQGTSAAEAEAGRTRTEKLLRMPPEQAGEIIVTAMERRAPRVLVGRDAKIMAFLERLAPIGHAGLFARMTRAR
jgi:NAD(P)-dependent dehydrogenase (short-subunit alcohol dehydrogenase family)